MSAPTIRAIVEATAAHYGLTRIDLLSFRREHAVSRPRQVAMYLAKRLTSRSLPEIGRQIGGRDHTTVMHGVARIETLSADDTALASAIGEITARLGASPSDQRESDPALVAIDLVSGQRRPTSVSVDETEAMARLIVGWGRALGAIAVEGEAGAAPSDVEIEDERSPAPDVRLVAAVDAVRTAYSGWATARFSPGERAALEALTKSLLALFETRSNI